MSFSSGKTGKTICAGVVALLLLVAPWTHRAPRAQTAAATARAAVPQRIISIVPALTEMLFAIGAGSRVVGVGNFDLVPPTATTIPRVGALIDPDVERILSLKPDLVLTYGSQTDLLLQLGRAGVRVFEYRHGGLADVTRAIRELGRQVGSFQEAERLASRLDGQLAAVRERVRGRARPRTLLVFGRQPLSLRGIYASGGIGFLHDMLETAGGANVFMDVKRESVQATTELILTRAPEAIVELRYGSSAAHDDLAAERGSWSILSAVPAVRQGRITMLVGDEFVVPGPRVADATERMARALHPDAFK